MFCIECMRMCGFRKQYWISWKLLISWLLTLDSDNFYRAMHFSAKRGIAIACRLSVCLSVCDVGEL